MNCIHDWDFSNKWGVFVCMKCKETLEGFKIPNRLNMLESDLANERALYAEKQTELAACPQWISVADGLPDKGVRVIVLLNDDCVETDWIDSTGTWWFNVTDVTYWMPRPLAPVTKETK